MRVCVISVDLPASMMAAVKSTGLPRFAETLRAAIAVPYIPLNWPPRERPYRLFSRALFPRCRSLTLAFYASLVCSPV
jgi:hypothetical protein